MMGVSDLGLGAGTCTARWLTEAGVRVDLLALEDSITSGAWLGLTHTVLSPTRTHRAELRKLLDAYDVLLIDGDLKSETLFALQSCLTAPRLRTALVAHHSLGGWLASRASRGVQAILVPFQAGHEGWNLAPTVADARTRIVPLARPLALKPAVARRQPPGWPCDPAGGLVVATMGHLDALMGCEALIQAFLHMKASGASGQLLVLGDGPGRLGLAAQAKALGVTAEFPGVVDHPEQWIACSDIYVAGGHRDESGWDVLTAMALGVPVVANRGLATVAGLLAPAQAGVLISKLQVDVIASELLALIRSADLRQTYRQRGLEQFRDLGDDDWPAAWWHVLRTM